MFSHIMIGTNDLDKAKALMKEAGYANGFDITCMTLAGSADDAAKVRVVRSLSSSARRSAVMTARQ